MRLRSLFRLALLALWSLAFVPPPLLLALFTLGDRRVRASTGPFLMQLFSRGACRIFGVRIRKSGSVPGAGPAFVTPNHWGYVDVLVLGSIYRGAFVSQADVARWPFVGIFARLGGTLFLERERPRDAVRVADAIEDALRAGRIVTAFLEGGVSPGRQILPFRTPLLAGAVRARAPCVPVAVRYTLPRDPGLDPGRVVAWVDEDLGTHLLRLLGTHGIEANVTFLPHRTGTDRKTLAGELESDVRAAFPRDRSDRAASPRV